ncbi:MAG: hypothetical protein NVS2B7_10060 [Herpetosiphon sp.]
MSAVATIDAAPIEYQATRDRRLAGLIALTCKTDAQIIQRFERLANEGVKPTAIDIIYTGRALDRIGRNSEAAAIRSRYPYVNMWYLKLGLFKIQHQRSDTSGLQDLVTASRIDPSWNAEKAPMYLYLCSATIRDNKQYVETDPCRDLDRVRPTATSRYFLGRSLYNDAQFNEAIVALNDAVQFNPASGEAYQWIGKTYLTMGNIGEAANAFRRGIANAADFPWNYLELAQLDIQEHCFSAARRTLAQLRAFNTPETTAAMERTMRTIDPAAVDGAHCE